MKRAYVALLLAAVALAPVPGQATQASMTVPVTASGVTGSPTFGNVVSQFINPALSALQSSFSGPAAPANAVVGQFWLDTSTSPYTLRQNTGGGWAAVYTLTGSSLSVAAPTLSTRGGVLAFTGAGSEWPWQLNTDGTWTFKQPAFTDLSGVLDPSQIPLPTLTDVGGVKAKDAVASQWLKSLGTDGAFTATQPAFSDLSGQIAASQLIAPGASTLGGVKSSSAPANQFATGVNTSGAVTYAQPTTANISGLSPYGAGGAGTGLNATTTAYSSANQALWLAGTLTGDGFAPYALISVTDTAANTAAIISGGGNPLAALNVAHNINSGAGEGNRFSINAVLTKNAATSGSDAAKKFYTPVFSQIYVKAGDGGTGAGASAKGAHYGLSALAQAESGATYLDGMLGGEIDVSVQTGASTNLKTALLLASVNSDAVKGGEFDGMLAFGSDSTATAKWTYGAAFGWPRGPWPFDTSSTLIGTVAPASGSRVANNGVDFSSVAFTGCAFKSSGFCAQDGGTVILTGALNGVSLGSRTGSGFVYQLYNPTGVGINVFNGTSDILSLTNAGGLYLSAEVSPGRYTVAGLPVCGSTNKGSYLTVTDGAGALAIGATVSGGGSTLYGVFCNSSNWVVAAK